MKSIYLIILSCTMLIGSLANAANWVEGEASMHIGDAPVDEIREKTIKNAIADAAFRSGAMVSSEEILLNGLLVNSKVMFQSQGMVRRAEVLHESIDNDIFTARVKVDIQFERACPAAKYSKSILITQFQLMKPKQAAIGGLYDLAKHVSKRLEQQLESQPEEPDLLLLDKTFTEVDVLNGIDRDEVTEKANYLRKKYGHQFTLFGVVRDLSTFNRISKSFFKEDVTTRRNFTIRIFVLDVYHKQIVLEKSYHTEADWDFGLHDEVDMNSSIFWQSDYGRAVLNTLSDAIVDIDEVISCSNLYAQIVQQTPDGYVINLGSRHGVKLGDKFNLNKVMANPSNHTSANVMIRQIPNSEIEVLAVDNNSALIGSSVINSAYGAHLLDLVSPVQ